MVANIEEVLQRGEALSGKCINKNKNSKCHYPSVKHVECGQLFRQCLHFNVSSLHLFLSALDTKASNLTALSKKYRSDAKYLNTRSTYAKVAAVAVVFLTLIIYVRFWWL